MKISTSIFRYIEHELYNYEETKKELKNCRESILEGTHISDVPVQSGLGDSTASKAIKLTTSNYILQMERVIKAIDKSLALLSDTHRDLFKLKYMDCLTLKEVYLEMNISKRSYYRIRRELIKTVGQQLGLIRI